MKKNLLATLLSVISQSYIYCQIMNWDENYSYTVLDDDFSNSQINLNKWSIENNNYYYHTVFIDSSATVSVDSGNLRLSVISCPNCGTESDWAGGKVISKDKFQYGIFESRIRFARKSSADGNFQLRGGNDVPCEQGGLHETELVIARYYWKQLSPTYYKIGSQIRDYNYGTDCVEDLEIKANYDTNSGDNSYITFKCIWTPSYVRCYMDNFLVMEILDTGQEWYPEYFLNLSLFQALDTDVPLYIEIPQTTYIDYVKVKKFFATPEITCPDNICPLSPQTATLDVDPQASNITWSLWPTNLFTGSTSGSGLTANIYASGTNKGEGKIIYHFTMPSGETFTKEKTFWVGKPELINLDISSTIAPGGHVLYCGDNILVLSNLYANQNIDEFFWDMDFSYTNFTQSGNAVEVYDVYDINNTGHTYISVKAENECGWSNYSSAIDFTIISWFLFSISPNPAIGETTIELTSQNQSDDPLISSVIEEKLRSLEWDLDIFDQNQVLKESCKKIKGNKIKLNVKNWKKGVYFVRARVNKEYVFGKLILSE